MSQRPPLGREAFLATTTALRIGKRLPDAVYLHKEAVKLLPTDLQRMVAWARDLAGNPPFNMVKLGRSLNHKISLLSYPAFFSDPFPSLAEAWTIDLDTMTVRLREWRQDGSQPILHRKEQMVPPGSVTPSITDRWAGLTRELEARGAYKDSARIGMAAVWAERLRKLGIEIRSHRIVAG